MKKIILLEIIFIIFCVFDFQLGKYAKGYLLFNDQLPFDFELKVDDNGEYKIVEEGFINIISTDQKVIMEKGDTINVQRLLKYATNDNKLFVYVKTIKGDITMEILIDKRRKMGTQLVFYSIENDENEIDWIDLEKDISLLIILHLSFQILFVVFLLKTLYNIV